MFVFLIIFIPLVQYIKSYIIDLRGFHISGILCENAFWAPSNTDFLNNFRLLEIILVRKCFCPSWP